MAAPVRLREDFDGPRLRASAKRSRDADQLRRLLAVAEVYAGRSRCEAARNGQKNKITRHWAKRGTRPVAPHDQRTRSACLFGAICPRGVGAGLVLPICNSAAMNLHLQEISANVAQDAHAIVILDQAGWQLSRVLEVP